MKTLTVYCRDGIVARDSRPFGLNKGNHAYSLDWPYPSTVAGSLRTLIGKLQGGKFDKTMIDSLKHVEVRGAFPRKKKITYLPAPLDAVFAKNTDGSYTRFAIKPSKIKDGEGCALPHDSLSPAFIEDEGRDGFKPAKDSPGFWPLGELEKWLSSTSIEPKMFTKKALVNFLQLPEKERRMHVSIDPETRTAKDQELFSITRLVPESNLLIGCRVPESISECLQEGENIIHPFGGQRILATWNAVNNDDFWQCPQSISEALENTNLVRMCLTTPAIYSGGWLPGWLKDNENTIQGKPPLKGSAGDLMLELVSACVGNWKPISGWSYETGGQKEIRRLVPAGSMYFFKVKEGNAKELTGAWLESTCDDEQDRRDGFGLAAWGTWGPWGP
ncbi:MAG: type III-B CRISPR module-associated protein Cmr3 [Promethearchaeota archaeon]